jgi:uncharacterized alpha-E superfamily protein
MYEDLNSSCQVRGCDCTPRAAGVRFLDWVKMRSHLFRGVTVGTLLLTRLSFIRLGTHLEQADNTARILDVKYHTFFRALRTSAAPSIATSGVRSSARFREFEACRKIYSDVIHPARSLTLILRRTCRAPSTPA